LSNEVKSASTGIVGTNPCAEVKVEPTVSYTFSAASWFVQANPIVSYVTYNSYGGFSPELKTNCDKCNLQAGDFVNVRKLGTNLNGPAEYMGCIGATQWKSSDEGHLAHVQILNGYQYHNNVKSVARVNLEKL
jgi:hypothetical protein